MFLILDFKDSFAWPDIAICPKPVFKNELAYLSIMKKSEEKSFKTEQELNELANDAYFSSPNEVIEAAFFSKDSYPNTLKFPIELKPPIVEQIQADYMRVGKCTVISTSKGRQQNLENFSNETDSDFTLLMLLKVSLQ